MSSISGDLPWGAGVRSSTSDGWAPVSIGTMRQILDQVDGDPDLSDEAIAEMARGVLVPPGRLRFAASQRTLGSALLMTMSLSALRVRAAAGLGPAGSVAIGFVLSGAVTLHPRGGERIRLGPGGAGVVNGHRPFVAESAAGTRILYLALPEQTLADRGVHVNAARYILDGARSLRGPLRSFALTIADTSWNSSTVGAMVAARTIEDLAVGMFLEADGYALDGEDLRAGLRGRALSEIAAAHRTPDLNPGVVAEHLSVSLRHLQRAFEHSGESIAHAITRKRVESAALLLSAPGGRVLTMDLVARDAGFRSAFELRAAFRAHYGMLPSEYRESRTRAPQ